jgi:hypothetical protein
MNHLILVFLFLTLVLVNTQVLNYTQSECLENCNYRWCITTNVTDGFCVDPDGVRCDTYIFTPCPKKYTGVIIVSVIDDICMICVVVIAVLCVLKTLKNRLLQMKMHNM